MGLLTWNIISRKSENEIADMPFQSPLTQEHNLNGVRSTLECKPLRLFSLQLSLLIGRLSSSCSNDITS